MKTLKRINTEIFENTKILILITTALVIGLLLFEPNGVPIMTISLVALTIGVGADLVLIYLKHREDKWKKLKGRILILVLILFLLFINQIF